MGLILKLKLNDGYVLTESYYFMNALNGPAVTTGTTAYPVGVEKSRKNERLFRRFTNVSHSYVKTMNSSSYTY